MTWEQAFDTVKDMSDTQAKGKLIVVMQTLQMVLDAKDGKHLFTLDDACKTARIVLEK